MLKNLKSLFVVVEEDSSPAATSQQKSTQAPTQRAEPHAAPARPSAQAAAGKVTAKFSDILLGALEKNNVDGFDYLEFKRSLQSLEKMPMDESTRFQSAFAMAQSMGATPLQLITTANHYLAVLAKEEKDFEGAIANQQAKNIGAKQESFNQMEQSIKAKEEQIRLLQQEIQTSRQQVEQIAAEIQDTKLKVETTKNDFLASYENLVSQIKKDIDNMQKFLK